MTFEEDHLRRQDYKNKVTSFDQMAGKRTVREVIKDVELITDLNSYFGESSENARVFNDLTVWIEEQTGR